MLGLNGGLIGKPRSVYVNKGIWTPSEQRLSLFDPYWDNVSLLLHMDGSNGSATFTDSSKNALTVTTNGNAQISTVQSKFGGASGAFDGAGDYLSISSNSIFEFGSGDFTVEAWVYPSSTTGDWMIASASGTGGFFMGYSNSFAPNGWGIGRSGIAWDFLSGVTTTTGSWRHVVACRSNGSLRMFVGGQQIGSTASNTTAYNIGLTSLTIGSQGAGVYFNGYIDDLRITKGAARYTANFTPPTAPFPDA